MIYILAGPRADTGPLNTRAVCGLAGERGVPVLVDAAAEVLTVPNVHLGAGASLVGYSGGKCLRGPQTAGLLLGRKDLVRAAWVHSAPHHGFARAMKVGKEEAIGMLMAVEMWMKRDHDAEWKRWTSWLEHIAERARTVDGVTTAIEPPEGLSNRTPSLVVRWDPERLGKDGGEIVARLYDGQPRIAVSRPEGKVAQGLTGIAVNPYMMSAGDERIVADGLVRALREPSPSRQPPERPSADLTGAWDVEIEFAAGKSTHGLFLRQQRDHLEGVHQAEFVSRDLMGSVQGDKVRIHSFYGEERGDSISFTFTGTIVGGSMSGDLSMGEYRDAKWSARRHGSGIV
jgi:L-seryl-tRNA(Ser) seleniumtransferase